MSILQKKNKVMADDLRIVSIGVCYAAPNDKKDPPCVVIAYQTQDAETPFFVMTPLQNKNHQPHTKESLLDAIRMAEEVHHITYVDPDGQAKNIYVCRAASGKITDVVERDYEAGCYVDGFSEIHAGNVKFRITEELEKIQYHNKLNLTLSGSADHPYEVDSYEYAIVNAFNACLLGKLFDKEELKLETRDRRRVRIQVSPEGSAYIDSMTLYIHPVWDESGVCIDHYETERFQYIDGENMSCRSYRIKYSNRFRSYDLTRTIE